MNQSTQTTKPRWFTMSFVPLISKKFTQFNSNEDRVSFFSLNKLHEFIKVYKDFYYSKSLYDSKSNVVYRISCKDRNASYVDG